MAEAARESLLALGGVGVRLGEREVLSGVGLEIRAGEIVTLIGPNGAGKTTLLRVALGLLAPDSGAVRRRPGLRIGYLPQRMAVSETLPLTVRRFLQLAERARGGRLDAVLEEVGAAHTPQTPLRLVSGGELQRVLLARALLREPELLVLDEPVQGVDLQGQVELFDLITRLRDRRGCSVLMVSHDLHLVMAKTDRVVCLNRTVCCTGTPAFVSREPAYQALFAAAAAAGLAPYAHAHAGEGAAPSAGAAAPGAPGSTPHRHG